MKILLAMILGAFALASGCVTVPTDARAVPAVHKQAAFDFDCPQDQLQIMELGHHKYGAKGCGKKATYTVSSCSPSWDECTVTKVQPIETAS